MITNTAFPESFLQKAKITFQFKSSRPKKTHNYAIIKDFKERCLI